MARKAAYGNDLLQLRLSVSNRFCSLLLLPAAAASLFGSPATFVTALPVAKDQMLIRLNAQPTFAIRQFHCLQVPVTVGYGLSSRWGLFTNINQGFGSLMQDTAAGKVRSSSGGSNDTLFYVRYTLYKRDKPKSTFRIAPLAGAFLPSGDNNLRLPSALLPKALQTGSGTVDPYFGLATGFNNLRIGMAADSTYRYNPVTNTGLSPGSQFRADAQFEVKLYPVNMPKEGLPKLVVFSVESNYVQDSKDHVRRVVSLNSGGRIVRQDAVLELSTLHWQIGLGAQLPIMQDLPGPTKMKQRSTFFCFTSIIWPLLRFVTQGIEDESADFSFGSSAFVGWFQLDSASPGNHIHARSRQLERRIFTSRLF